MDEHAFGHQRDTWPPAQENAPQYGGIRDLSNLPYREVGSGWLLFGTLLLLFLTALAGTYAYFWTTFWEDAHPLDWYWPFALFAWIMAGLGAGVLHFQPLPGKWNLVPLLAPFILLGIWLAVVYVVDARYEPADGGTTCFITACG